jgi:uncharacterized protein YkwD
MSLRRTALLALAASGFTFIPVTSAGAQTSAGLNAFDRELIADLNAARIERGIAPLNLSNRLESIATDWSGRMASDQNARNNPRLRSEINASCPAWRKLGENVAEADGTTADEVFAAYMRNADNRHTMLNRKFTWVGVHSEETDDKNGSPVTWSVLDFANHCS